MPVQPRVPIVTTKTVFQTLPILSARFQHPNWPTIAQKAPQKDLVKSPPKPRTHKPWCPFSALQEIKYLQLLPLLSSAPMARLVREILLHYGDLTSNVLMYIKEAAEDHLQAKYCTIHLKCITMNVENLICRLREEDVIIGPPDVSTGHHAKFCKCQTAYKNKHMNHGEALAAVNKRK